MWTVQAEPSAGLSDLPVNHTSDGVGRHAWADREDSPENGLTRQVRPSSVGELPRVWLACDGWDQSGVWLFFENSTGCL